MFDNVIQLGTTGELIILLYYVCPMDHSIIFCFQSQTIVLSIAVCIKSSVFALLDPIQHL